MKNRTSELVANNYLLTEKYINTRQLFILNSVQVDKICRIEIKRNKK